MKHQVHRLIAMLITLLIVCSVLSPVAYCENNSYGSMVGGYPGKETRDEEKEDGKEDKLIEEGKPVTFGETSTVFDAGWEETGEVTIVETVQSTSGSNTVTYKTYKTRYSSDNESTSGSNTVTYKTYKTRYSSDNKKLWRVYLTATFEYNGTSAKCISSEISVEEYNNYEATYKTSYYRGNTATATADFGYDMGIKVLYVGTTTVTITCDKYGICH